MLDFACEKNPNSVDTPDLTSRTMWCSGRQTSHNPGCGYLKLQSCIGTWLDGSGQRCKKKQPFFLRWGVCFPPWFDAFLCHSWNWSRYRESSMGRGCSLSLIIGVYSVYWTSLLVSDRVLFGLDHSHSLLFLLPFFRIGCAFICHFQHLGPWNFVHFCQGFTCASHLDTILVSIVSIGRLSTAWCKLDCHTPVSRWGCGGMLPGLDGEAASADYVIKTFQRWRASDVWSSFDHLKQVVSSCRAWGSLLFSDGIYKMDKLPKIGFWMIMWFHRGKQTLNYEQYTMIQDVKIPTCNMCVVFTCVVSMSVYRDVIQFYTVQGGQDSIISTSMHLAMPLNPSNYRGLLAA